MDEIVVRISSGNGGRGAVSFGREANKRIAPPDGGAGGKGGDVYVQVHDEKLNLKGMRLRYKADAGASGQGGHRQGARGKDLFLTIPRGCLLTELERHAFLDPSPASAPLDSATPLEPTAERPSTTDESTAPSTETGKHKSKRVRKHVFLEQPHAQVAEAKQRPSTIPSDAIHLDTSALRSDDVPHLILRGGRGGRGNASYASAQNRSPMQYQPGGFGEDRTFRIEYKMLADVGLVGFPNAGKSSLLNCLTRSRQKVGYWPFTTIRPSIGVMQRPSPSSGTTLAEPEEGGEEEEEKEPSLRVADIPGIIEGASDNVGMGHAFLRHIQKSRLLLFVIDMAAADPEAHLHILREELRKYDKALLQRDWLLICNKMDAVDTALHATRALALETFAHRQASAGMTAPPKATVRVSALTHENLETLRDAIWRFVGSSSLRTRQEDTEAIEDVPVEQE